MSQSNPNPNSIDSPTRNSSLDCSFLTHPPSKYISNPSASAISTPIKRLSLNHPAHSLGWLLLPLSAFMAAAPHPFPRSSQRDVLKIQIGSCMSFSCLKPSAYFLFKSTENKMHSFPQLPRRVDVALIEPHLTVGLFLPYFLGPARAGHDFAPPDTPWCFLPPGSGLWLSAAPLHRRFLLTCQVFIFAPLASQSKLLWWLSQERLLFISTNAVLWLSASLLPPVSSFLLPQKRELQRAETCLILFTKTLPVHPRCSISNCLTNRWIISRLLKLFVSPRLSDTLLLGKVSNHRGRNVFSFST